jgi:acetoin utilization protein AcuC
MNGSMKAAFLYSDDFAQFSYGANHPLKLIRLKLTYELIRACGLLGPSDPRLVHPQVATRSDLLTFHTPEYLDMLQAVNTGRTAARAEFFGLGPGDNPVFPGLLDGSLLAAGASLAAAELVDSGEADIAFNIAGGLHHAMADHASGFCYVNDPVIAIKRLVARGRRVAYIDIDAHHGDGVQSAFYGTDKVLTISLHETGRLLFPGTGFEQELGEGAGRGFNLNVPLPPECDDELFLHAFSGIVPAVIDRFKPDIVVSQLGVDTFRTDPLAHLNLTTHGFCETLSRIKALAPKWVALGGGGYDIANVARAWTLAWAIMSGAEAPADIPASFLQQYPEAGFTGSKLRDEQNVITGAGKEAMKKEVERVIAYLNNMLFDR